MNTAAKPRHRVLPIQETSTTKEGLVTLCYFALSLMLFHYFPLSPQIKRIGYVVWPFLLAVGWMGVAMATDYFQRPWRRRLTLIGYGVLTYVFIALPLATLAFSLYPHFGGGKPWEIAAPFAGLPLIYMANKCTWLLLKNKSPLRRRRGTLDIGAA